MNRNQDSRAVSPVIGVALMIGIVVVLAGAIGFAVLDFGSDVGAEPQASVDIEQIDSEYNDAVYRVTWVSEGNSDFLTVRGADNVNSGSTYSSAVTADTDISSGTVNVYDTSSTPNPAAADSGYDGVLNNPGESFTVAFGDTGDTGQVSVLAVIAENPDDSTAVVEGVSN